MRSTLLLSLLVPAAAACTDQGVQITEDTPIAVAASADRLVVAATQETESTGFGCGGGASYGPSVLFVSGDRGTTFERIVPADARPLTRIASRDGIFYAIAHNNDGSFGVVTSADARSWTEVASGTGYAQDLAISDAAIVVAHGAGVLVSADGSTWTNHQIDGGAGIYQVRVAHAAGMTALGSAAEGTIRLSSDASTWSDYAVPGLNSISQLIGAGDSLLATGWSTGGTSAVARIDLANLEAAPVIRTGFANNVILTPAGLLDAGGQLASLDANGIGQPVAHLEPFHAAAVDANDVVVLRGHTIATSTDGGRTFDGTIELLPIVRTETPIAD